MKGIIRTIAKIEIPIWFHNLLTVDQSKQFKKAALSRGGKTQSPESIDFHSQIQQRATWWRQSAPSNHEDASSHLYS